MENDVVIVSFSSKNGGNCEHISEYIRFLSNDSVEIFRFTDFIIHSCGGCCYECFVDNRSCPYIDDPEYQILEDVCKSSMTYFVLPNYCNYPCSNFFTFNERSQCFFQHHEERLEAYLKVPKKFVVVSNTGSDNFIEAMTQHTISTPEILFLSARRYGKVSIEEQFWNPMPRNPICAALSKRVPNQTVQRQSLSDTWYYSMFSL